MPPDPACYRRQRLYSSNLNDLVETRLRTLIRLELVNGHNVMNYPVNP